MNEAVATLPGVGYRHQREDMLAAAVTVARRDGLAALTFGRVAKQLGTNDRTVVYYFPTKADLVGAVTAELGGQLQALLADAFGDKPLSRRALGRRAWPALSHPDADPIFRLFFEVIGLAAVGRKPFDDLVGALMDQWLAWLEPRLDIADPMQRQAEALALLAQIDGLLLLRITAGPSRAQAAAAASGFARAAEQ
jgi:AcrR family transcriptional regulator